MLRPDFPPTKRRPRALRRTIHRGESVGRVLWRRDLATRRSQAQPNVPSVHQWISASRTLSGAPRSGSRWYTAPAARLLPTGGLLLPRSWPALGAAQLQVIAQSTNNHPCPDSHCCQHVVRQQDTTGGVDLDKPRRRENLLSLTNLLWRAVQRRFDFSRLSLVGSLRPKRKRPIRSRQQVEPLAMHRRIEAFTNPRRNHQPVFVVDHVAVCAHERARSHPWRRRTHRLHRDITHGWQRIFKSRERSSPRMAAMRRCAVTDWWDLPVCCSHHPLHAGRKISHNVPPDNPNLPFFDTILPPRWSICPHYHANSMSSR